MTDTMLRSVSAVLALAGAGIAAYLTYARYADVRLACATGGCETVQQSSYAEIAGVPVAVLGLGAYLFLAASALLASPHAIVAAAIVAIGGLGFSLYLLWAQLFEIDAVCQWCIASDVLIALLAAVAMTRLLRTAPPRAKPTTS